jgi:hypothetical protein
LLGNGQFGRAALYIRARFTGTLLAVLMGAGLADRLL